MIVWVLSVFLILGGFKPPSLPQSPHPSQINFDSREALRVDLDDFLDGYGAEVGCFCAWEDVQYARECIKEKRDIQVDTLNRLLGTTLGQALFQEEAHKV